MSDPSMLGSQIGMMAGAGLLGGAGGQSPAGQQRLGYLLPMLEHNFNPMNLGMVGTQRAINSPIMLITGNNLLQGQPGPIAKAIMEAFQQGNQDMASVAANHTGDIQEALLQGVELAPMDYGGDFSASRGNVAPSGPAGGGSGSLEIG